SPLTRSTASAYAPMSHDQAGPWWYDSSRRRAFPEYTPRYAGSEGARVRRPYDTSRDRPTASTTWRAGSPSRSGYGSETAKIWFGLNRNSSPATPSTTSAQYRRFGRQNRTRNEAATWSASVR